MANSAFAAFICDRTAHSTARKFTKKSYKYSSKAAMLKRLRFRRDNTWIL